MKPRYYIYRNLRTGGFSVRYCGRVIDRLHTFTAEGVEFRVNEKGRQKVIKDRQKNVHAFVVADKYTVEKYPILTVDEVDRMIRITYNPYTDTQFKCHGFNFYSARKIIFQNGRCFLALE